MNEEKNLEKIRQSVSGLAELVLGTGMLIFSDKLMEFSSEVHKARLQVPTPDFIDKTACYVGQYGAGAIALIAAGAAAGILFKGAYDILTSAPWKYPKKK